MNHKCWAATQVWHSWAVRRGRGARSSKVEHAAAVLWCAWVRMGVESSSVAARAAAALRSARPLRERLNGNSLVVVGAGCYTFANHRTNAVSPRRLAEAYFFSPLKKRPPGLLSSHVPEQIKTLTSFWGSSGAIMGGLRLSKLLQRQRERHSIRVYDFIINL